MAIVIYRSLQRSFHTKFSSQDARLNAPINSGEKAKKYKTIYGIFIMKKSKTLFIFVAIWCIANIILMILIWAYYAKAQKYCGTVYDIKETVARSKNATNFLYKEIVKFQDSKGITKILPRRIAQIRTNRKIGDSLTVYYRPGDSMVVIDRCDHLMAFLIYVLFTCGLYCAYKMIGPERLDSRVKVTPAAECRLNLWPESSSFGTIGEQLTFFSYHKRGNVITMEVGKYGYIEPLIICGLAMMIFSLLLLGTVLPFLLMLMIWFLLSCIIFCVGMGITAYAYSKIPKNLPLLTIDMETRLFTINYLPLSFIQFREKQFSCYLDDILEMEFVTVIRVLGNRDQSCSLKSLPMYALYITTEKLSRQLVFFTSSKSKLIQIANIIQYSSVRDSAHI